MYRNRIGKKQTKPVNRDITDLVRLSYLFIELLIASKLPRFKGWRNLPSVDPFEVFARGGNVGVRLRPLDLVIDVDPRNFPAGRRPDLELGLDRLECPMVISGSGGRHYYLQLEEEQVIRKSLREYPGIDFLHFGNYVLAPGCIHPVTRRRYIAEPMGWFDEGPAPFAPATIRSLIAVQSVTGGVESALWAPEQLAEVLDLIDVCDYAAHDDWFRIMCASHEVTGGLGIEEFVAWSAGNPTFAHLSNEVRYRWKSLHSGKDRNAGAGTLLHTLITAGIEPPNFASPGSDFEDAPTGEMKPPAAGLCIVDSAEFLAAKFPPREGVLDPIIKTQSGSMVHAWRGFGKTFFILSGGVAVASGGKFLKWSAPKPRRVVYIDGEMPGVDMQSRLSSIVRGMKADIEPGYFRILNGDLQPSGVSIPLLSERSGQKRIEDQLKDTELLILDNLSCLMRGDENEAESWIAMQEWLLSLRRRNVSVILIHHSGKEGAQRGTSKREDVLDTVITLKRPAGYLASEGARFEIHFEKCRGVYGDAVEPFEVRLETELTGAAVWITESIETVRASKAEDLFAAGMSVQDVMKELNVSRATAFRLKAKTHE